MRTLKNAALICFLLPLVFGCKKDPLNHMTDEESRIYITDHDSTVNFSNYKTFSVSDSVALIQNGKKKMQLNDADAAYIQAVKGEMEARGYTLVSREASPDLGLTVNRIISTTTGVISTGSYWDMYQTYWDTLLLGYPGFGYYLPYSYAVYQIREGL